MLKLTASLVFSAVMVTSAKPMFEQRSIVDSHGKLILMQGEETAAMTGQCKSYKLSKNPPLVPRLKCRFS